MTFPTRPTGYDVANHVDAGRPDCHLTVGFDLERSHVPRFLVQLHYRTATDPVRLGAIARMDHNETPGKGHDVYREGLHVDVARRSRKPVHLDVPHPPLPANRGHVIRGCIEYLRQDAGYFIDVYEERRRPGRPPWWSPDGGDSAGTFIRSNRLDDNMGREVPAEEEVLTPEEFSEVLAEATGTTAEEIERGAEEIDLAPPWEAEVAGHGEHDGEHGFLIEADAE